jgi:hypothetical protein
MPSNRPTAHIDRWLSKVVYCRPREGWSGARRGETYAGRKKAAAALVPNGLLRAISAAGARAGPKLAAAAETLNLEHLCGRIAS